MKVKRMEITEILRKIWLFSANKIKNLNSTHRRTQLIIAAHNCYIKLNLEFYRNYDWNYLRTTEKFISSADGKISFCCIL